MSASDSAVRRRPRAAAAPWNDLVVVCATCAKRQGLGGRVRKDLKRALKRARPERKVRVVETGCLGLCPKRSLTFATPASLRAGRLLVLDPATEAETMAEILVPEPHR
ncbi:(2Fe-2S) ferredoxin domain-containing protein [Methylobacterium sp. WSM2598]|uniref:(2Fe-2S) ferredoxin domain-containing protein n=1 Tax=Methylobacterium sp. WSM2598 TaxID=398261 RepID=UPI0003618796|nr:(2Fe-2S) ferredoxin domain-containing protein [Methylobacterium sp. WSM2598]